MDEKKVQEIFSDEEFVVSLLKMETPEEVQSAVKAKGLELSVSDIQKVKALLVSGKTDELSADELEGVSGGANDVMALGIATCIGSLSLAVGLGVGLCVGISVGISTGLALSAANRRW